MKHVSLAFWVLGLLLFSAAAAADSGSLCGTWVNPQQANGARKIIFDPDGSYRSFDQATGIEADRKGICKISERWRDPHGSVWIKGVFWTDLGEKTFCLMKISDSGHLLECVRDSRRFPLMINPEAYAYDLFYRK